LVTGTITGSGTKSLLISSVNFEPTHVSVMITALASSSSMVGSIIAGDSVLSGMINGYGAPYNVTVTYNSSAKTLTIANASYNFDAARTYQYILSA
jgi:hypothetical protein